MESVKAGNDQLGVVKLFQKGLLKYVRLIPRLRFLSNFISHWTSQDFVDAVVKCRDKSWHIHRSILSAHSAFFLKAFTNGMAVSRNFPTLVTD